MDIISHVLIGTSVIRNPQLFWPVSLASILPDLLMFVPSHTYMFLKKFKDRKSFKLFSSTRWWNCPTWIRNVYNLTHSILGGIIFSLFILVFFRDSSLVIWAWWLHLGLDIFTHGGQFRVKLFFPFSNYTLPIGINWFANQYLVAGNMSLALILFYFTHLPY